MLQSLPFDFHLCLTSGGEEGKKLYTSCVKKLKAELGSAKSSCVSEIQQLFPLAQKTYDVATVKPPTFTASKGGASGGERIKVSSLKYQKVSSKVALSNKISVRPKTVDYIQYIHFNQICFHARSSSLEGAMKLKFVPFCSS